MDSIDVSVSLKACLSLLQLFSVNYAFVFFLVTLEKIFQYGRNRRCSVPSILAIIPDCLDF